MNVDWDKWGKIIEGADMQFVYDKDGKLFYTHIGYRPGDEQELLNQVRKCYGK